MYLDNKLCCIYAVDQVFIKTYAERRSWLAPFRAFYRVFALQMVLFHIVMAQVGAPVYPIWEAASVDEWSYNGGPYQLIGC